MASRSDRMNAARRSIEAARSFLFVPASRPERIVKAHNAGADVVIIDLEDAVAPEDKESALEAALEWLSTAGGPSLSMVRINASGTPWHDGEVAALARVAVPLMIPKVESADWLSFVSKSIAAPVVPLIETPRGVLSSESIACADGVVRLALGHIDLAAALAVAPDCREAFLMTRSHLVLASAAAGLPSPIDGVTTVVDDDERLMEDVAHASALGFGSKLCIHPRQVLGVHTALRPSDADREWAERVLAVVDSDERASAGGAIAVDGEMIDMPVVTRARAITARTQ